MTTRAEYLDQSEFHTQAERLFLNCLLKYTAYRQLQMSIKPAEAYAYANQRTFSELDQAIITTAPDELREEWIPLRIATDKIQELIRARALEKLKAISQPDITLPLESVSSYVNALFPQMIEPK